LSKGRFDYSAKAGRIYVVELTSASTWVSVLTAAQSRSIRGFQIKSRFTSGGAGPPDFDIALKASPDSGESSGDGFLSFSGGEKFDSFGPSNGLWCRSTKAGALIEIITFE